MNFGDVFSKAWNTVWKNKILWIFGFFASLLAYRGNGGDNNSGIRWQENIRYTPEELPRIFNNFGEGIQSFFDQVSTGEWIALGLGVFVLIFIWFLVSMFFGHLGRGAVIRGAVLADTEGKLKFSQLWKQGLHYFLKLLALTGLLWAAGFAAVVVIVIISIVTLGIGALVFLCLALPISIGVGLWVIQTTIFIVVEDEGVFDAIKHAWNFVFEEHLGNYLLMGLILFVGSIIAGFVIFLPLLIMGIPTALVLFSGGGIATLGIVMGIIAILLYILWSIPAQGLVTSFTWASWTYFYQDLVKGDERNAEELEVLSLEGGLPSNGEML
jgi:hypothetical protein